MYNFKTIAKTYCTIITLSIVYCNTIYGEETAALKIPEEKLLKHISSIASKETEGRLMGIAGSHKAGRYIEGHYAEYGLMPVEKHSGYSQNFETKVRHLGSANHLSIGNKMFEIKNGFIPLHFSAEGEASGVSSYAGYGLKIADFKGSEGKIAIVLNANPVEGENRNNLIIKKAELAQESGAKGLIIAVTSADLLYNDLTTFPEFIPPAYLKRWQSQHPSMTDTLLEIKTTSTIARTCPELVSGIKTPTIKIPVVMAVIEEGNLLDNLSVNIKIKFNDRLITGKNIMGLIKGKDDNPLNPPLLRGTDEVVIIGAHYDHLGKDGEGNIFYGADDNGTGIAALLEIASAFSKIKDRHKRNILFIAFDGEEWGLLGAKAYINNPAFPHEKVVAMLNMDTIGRNKPDEIYLLGSLRSPDLKRLNDRVNENNPPSPPFNPPPLSPPSEGGEKGEVKRGCFIIPPLKKGDKGGFSDTKIGLKLLDTIEFAFDHGSDHYPFYEKGIPSIDYTSSYHEDFHKVTDTDDKVNIEKVSRVAELIFRVACEIAATDIKFDKPKNVYVPFPKKH